MENWLSTGFIALSIFTVIHFIITLALAQRLSELLELAKANQRPEMIKAGEPAPAMDVLDLTGQHVTQEAFAGDELAMVFVSPHCSPCREAMPGLHDAYHHARANDTELLVISTATVEESQQFADELNVQIPLYALPEDSSLQNDFRILATPSYYLIDPEWHVKEGGNLDSDWRRVVDNWRTTSAVTSA